MIKYNIVLPLSLMLFLSIGSCKKDQNKPDSKTPDYTLVKSGNWKTLEKDVIGAGNSGGTRLITLALNQYTPDMLRWMYAITTPNYTNNFHEMMVNTSDRVSISTSFPTETIKFHLKMMKDGHE